MLAPQHKLVEATNRVDQFLDDYHVELDGALPPGARQVLTRARDQLLECRVVQEAMNRKVRASTAIVRALRDRLVQDHMLPIALAAARVGHEFPVMAGLTDRQSRKMPYTAIVARAFGLAENCREREASLLAEGLLFPGFIDELDAAASTLQHAIAARSLVVGQRVGATTGLKQSAEEAHKALRIIEVFIRKRFRSDEPMLARWRVARRVERAIAAPRRVALTAGAEQRALPSKAPELLLLPAGRAPEADIRAAAPASALLPAGPVSPDIEPLMPIVADRASGTMAAAPTRAVRRRALSALFRFFSRDSGAPERVREDQGG